MNVIECRVPFIFIMITKPTRKYIELDRNEYWYFSLVHLYGIFFASIILSKKLFEKKKQLIEDISHSALH